MPAHPFARSIRLEQIARTAAVIADTAQPAQAWGAETRSSCRGALVFVDKAAEQVAAAHPKSPRRRLRSEA
jgi:hypothetical protein